MKTKKEIKAMIIKCENDLPELRNIMLFSHVHRLENWIKSLRWVLEDNEDKS